MAQKDQNRSRIPKIILHHTKTAAKFVGKAWQMIVPKKKNKKP